MSLPLPPLTNLAESAVRAAAKILHQDFLSDAQLISAHDKDFKTRADRASEACILEHLHSSGIPVLAEESGGELKTEGPLWIVDPLDGTINFARGFPVAAVSVALAIDGQPVLGIILDLFRNRLYRGSIEEAATCNGQPIRVSTVSEPGQAILSTGFPVARDYSGEALQSFIRKVQAFKKIRMIGSAALSLAFVAEGTFDAHMEEGTYFWDVAAGMALVQAAGGVINARPEPGQRLTLWAAGHANLVIP